MPSNFSSRAPWKRSACDRCRAQKLRCIRDEDQPTDACMRCVKSGAKCVTSMARPTGRPPSRQPPVDQTSQTSNSSPDDSGVDMGMIGLDYDISLDNFFSSIGMQHSDVMMDEEIFMDNDTLPQSPHQHGVPHTHIPCESGIEFSSSQSEFPAQHHTLDAMPHQQPAEPAATIRTDDAELLLSKLDLDLSSQLFSIKSVPWDVKDILQLTFSHTGNEKDPVNPQSHPVLQLSNAATELGRLLKSLLPNQTTENHLSSQQYSPNFLPRRLRTTQLLVALSCYIHIVSIYDIIFTKVYDYLTNNSVPSTAALPSAEPTLYLGSLPIPPNQMLPGILLVHLAENQLHQIELLMGLPDHSRVSSRSNDRNQHGKTGLFAGQNSQLLLNAVIQLGDDRNGNHDDIRCVQSLRNKMRQIKDS
ncbi:unnamed protein product [Penicillium olsonii]|uniref:Zn(2)-C6 fungal-type domain-containing protein n=1 Tax=Penicillium olsonii TaxID=99116 RepID=A0A9W4HPY0_PENOL|nr:unnamed protein product [Penicillium olsonii]CAG8083994.1 unnamed protein product [Penicillium olsonii]